MGAGAVLHRGPGRRRGGRLGGPARSDPGRPGEWRRRLDAAIDLVTADTPVERQIGDELLADLIESDLGSEEDRTLARRIARIRLGEQLGERARGAPAVDLAVLPGDNGGDGVQQQEEEQ